MMFGMLTGTLNMPDAMVMPTRKTMMNCIQLRLLFNLISF